MMSMQGSAMQPSVMINQQVPRRSRPEDAASYITVSDPVQHADGLNKYTSYRVDVRPSPPPQHDAASSDEILPGHHAPPSAVLRRYSDFLWLYERLHADRPGAVVPPLPEKQPVGRFSPAFVEDRRVHLERFLRRVAVHPELADCGCLDTFLRADDVSFQAAKQARAAGGAAVAAGGSSASFLQQSQQYGMQSVAQQQSPAAAANKKEGLKRWFAEAKTSMTGDLVRSPDDDLFEEIARYVSGLDVQMRNVSAQAGGLVRKGKEVANGLFEFGLAFNLLGQSEADALGGALGRMGETADRLSVLAAEQAAREMAQFEEPLQDYLKTIHAVKLALQRRHEKRLTYSTCLAAVESKQQALHKLRSQIGSEAKAYQTEMSLRRAQEQADLARDDFCATSQRVLREVDRFKREKAEDMRRTVLDYISIQVEYNRRMEELWAALIPELEKVPAATDPRGGGTALSSPQPQPQPQSTPSPVSPESSQQLMGGPPSPYAPPAPPPPPPPQANQPPGGDGMISVQYRE